MDLFLFFLAYVERWSYPASSVVHQTAWGTGTFADTPHYETFECQIQYHLVKKTIKKQTNKQNNEWFILIIEAKNV